MNERIRELTNYINKLINQLNMLNKKGQVEHPKTKNNLNQFKKSFNTEVKDNISTNNEWISNQIIESTIHNTLRKKSWSNFDKLNEQVDNSTRKLYRICLTGGPCAGKTTALEYIRKAMEAHNIITIIIPKARTILKKNFESIPNFQTYEKSSDFQMGILRTQLAMEGIFSEMAYDLQQINNLKKDVLVLCDRGCMDGAAFIDTNEFISSIETQNWNISMLRDNRYDMVIHMTTAALGALNYFKVDGREPISEEVDNAILQDNRIKNAYLGHPRVKTIFNNEDKTFEEKLNKCVRVIEQLFHKNVQKKSDYFKYLLNLPDSDDSGVPRLDNLEKDFEAYYLDEVFLNSTNDAQIRKVKHRYSLKSHSYSYHFKDESNNTKKLISAKEYFNYLKTEQNPNFLKVKKYVQTFYDKGTLYKLETLKRANKLMYMMRVYLEENERGKPELPQFLTIAKDVMNDKEFDTRSLYQLSNNFDANKQYVRIIYNQSHWEVLESNKGFTY